MELIEKKKKEEMEEIEPGPDVPKILHLAAKNI